MDVQVYTGPYLVTRKEVPRARKEYEDCKDSD